MAYPTDPIYKLVKDPSNDQENSVLYTEKYQDDTSKQWQIPFGIDNLFYKEYLEWVAEGNTPEAADL